VAADAERPAGSGRCGGLGPIDVLVQERKSSCLCAGYGSRLPGAVWAAGWRSRSGAWWKDLSELLQLVTVGALDFRRLLARAGRQRGFRAAAA